MVGQPGQYADLVCRPRASAEEGCSQQGHRPRLRKPYAHPDGPSHGPGKGEISPRIEGFSERWVPRAPGRPVARPLLEEERRKEWLWRSTTRNRETAGRRSIPRTWTSLRRF